MWPNLLWRLGICLACVATGYLAVQVAIVVALVRRVWQQRASLMERLIFAPELPVRVEDWRALLKHWPGITSVMFDYDRVLAPRGSIRLYPGATRMLQQLLAWSLGVAITTNSTNPCVDVAARDAAWFGREVGVQRIPRHQRGPIWRFVPDVFARYFRKKPWKYYWTTAFSSHGRSEGHILVLDDKIENLIWPWVMGARAMYVRPMPGDDYRSDKIWALRWRERMILRILGLHQHWQACKGIPGHS